MDDAIHPGTRPLSGVGLEILYATPVPAGHAAAKPPRDLAKELRERFWISAARDAGTGPRSWAAVQVTFEWPIERVAVGRDRNNPGDGFRHVFRTGTGGTDSRSEWFGATEVFEGVRAAAVESFVRLANGGRGGPGSTRSASWPDWTSASHGAPPSSAPPTRSWPPWSGNSPRRPMTACRPTTATAP